MKKFLTTALAFASLALCASPVLADGEYAAVAIGKYGHGYYAWRYSSMEGARAAAVALCRRDGGGSCSTSTAESQYWYYSVGFCDGQPYTAASEWDYYASDQGVRNKARKDNRYDCRITGRAHDSAVER